MGTDAAAMEYDPFSPEFQTSDPFEVYRWMRDEAPVYYSEKWNWWALSRFEDVRAAALDPDTFRSYEGIDIDDTAKDQSGPGFLPDVDNPRHDQVRAVVQPFFLPRRIGEQLEDGRGESCCGLHPAEEQHHHQPQDLRGRSQVCVGEGGSVDLAGDQAGHEVVAGVAAALVEQVDEVGLDAGGRGLRLGGQARVVGRAVLQLVHPLLELVAVGC